MTSVGDLRRLRSNGNCSHVDSSRDPTFVVSRENIEWYVHTALVVIAKTAIKKPLHFIELYIWRSRFPTRLKMDDHSA